MKLELFFLLVFRAAIASVIRTLVGDLNLIREGLHENVLIVHLKDFWRREFQLGLHLLHRVERNNSVFRPHLVLNQANLIRNIEENENVLIKLRGHLVIVFAEPVFEVRRIANDRHILHRFGIVVNGGEEDFPDFLFVLEVIDRSEPLFPDFIA